VSNADVELFKVHRQVQEKHDYFLLAAAGAAIGFALAQTKDAHLGWDHALLGVAVLSWGLSFYAGCRRLSYVDSNLWVNAELRTIMRGEHPEVGAHPQRVAAAAEGTRIAFDRNMTTGRKWGIAQFRLLIAGALAYVGWHILQMYLRGH
jgi:hypothetical protein